jgi:glycerol-3-phosphate acyltransferase PlsY
VTALLLLVGFVIGATPFGVIVARRRGVDIRRQGSGNIGATNVTRVLGIGPGALVLVLDVAKGALAALAAARWSGLPWATAATGFAAIAGHCFSPWLGGKGGKGVATALGVFVVLAPELAVVAVGVFLLVAGMTRIPALGSLAAIAAATIVAFVVHADPALRTFAAATLALLVYTHRSNLSRL